MWSRNQLPSWREAKWTEVWCSIRAWKHGSSLNDWRELKPVWRQTDEYVIIDTMPTSVNKFSEETFKYQGDIGLSLRDWCLTNKE